MWQQHTDGSRTRLLSTIVGSCDVRQPEFVWICAPFSPLNATFVSDGPTGTVSHAVLASANALRPIATSTTLIGFR